MLVRPTSRVITRCIDPHPTKRTRYFMGLPINVPAISQSFEPNLDRAYLHRILTGEQTPSIAMARAMAQALGIAIGPLLEALEDAELAYAASPAGATDRKLRKKHSSAKNPVDGPSTKA